MRYTAALMILLLGCGSVDEVAESMGTGGDGMEAPPDAGAADGSAGGAPATGGRGGAGGRAGAMASAGTGGPWIPPPGGGTTGSAGVTGRGGTTGSAGAAGTKAGGALCTTSAECTYGPCVAGGCSGRVCRTDADCLNGDLCNDGFPPFDYCANNAPAGGCSCGHGW